MGKETGQQKRAKGSVRRTRRGERKRASRREVKKKGGEGEGRKRSETDQGSHFLRVVFSLGESYSIRLYWFARGRERKREFRGRGGEKEERNQEGR
jgi:hypothetical protein